MKRFSSSYGLALAVLVALSVTGRADNGSDANQSQNSQGRKDQKFPDFNEVTKGAEKIDGFFTLHYNEDEGKLFAEIKPNQFNTPVLTPIAIARGLGMAGHPLHQMDQWVLMFRRVGDRVQIIRRNIRYEAPKGSPISRAVEQNFTDSIIKAIPIRSERGKTVLIDLADIFFTNFAQIGLGGLDRSRTSWNKVKAFPNNVEIQVEATFGGGRGLSLVGGSAPVIDSRGVTLVIHYSLAKLPQQGYQPRFADQRVGHFLNATKDYGKDDPDTYFVRRINRWPLKKANPGAELSPPEEKIVWWVENTVPYEFRPYVEEGILAWNDAFEKIGFKKPLEVRWQGPDDEFDPENIEYCTFRWLTSGSTYAMSGIRANPITGEIVDGDVVFDASWIKYWRNQYTYLMGSSPAFQGEEDLQVPLAKGEIVSPILAAEKGYGLPFPLPSVREELDRAAAEYGGDVPDLVPGDWSPEQMRVRRALSGALAGGEFGLCQYADYQSYQLGLAAMALAGRQDKGDENGEDENGKAENGEVTIPDEFLGQAIRMIVMHEVGHSLGLRHNFKASSIRKNDRLHDTDVTREKGMVGSVMDYLPVNLALDQEKQGDYYPTSIGPYDYWAIEYAYKPIRGNEERALREIASRSPESELAFATDEDLYLSHDPKVNTWDLGADPVAFGKTRVKLAQRLMGGLDEQVVREGESWERLRRAFSVLLAQYGDAAYLAAKFIGGQNVHRDHKGPEGRDPVRPLGAERQREALEFVVGEVLSDEAFDFPPRLLRRLTSERWLHWGTGSYLSGGGIGYPIYERILSIQRIVLNHCLDGQVLSRLQNHSLMVKEEERPLEIAEVLRTLTDAIWSEVEISESEEGKTVELSVSKIRRNLQRAHLERLSQMVLGRQQSPYYSLYSYVMFYSGASFPPDAKSLAKSHLEEIRHKIDEATDRDDVDVDETTLAHLDEVSERIGKVLEASLQVNSAW